MAEAFSRSAFASARAGSARASGSQGPRHVTFRAQPDAADSPVGTPPAGAPLPAEPPCSSARFRTPSRIQRCKGAGLRSSWRM
eukprot:11443203-Alexandrium_andersonii.AAC.1